VNISGLNTANGAEVQFYIFDAAGFETIKLKAFDKCPLYDMSG
jgi:hypothetical protein